MSCQVGKRGDSAFLDDDNDHLRKMMCRLRSFGYTCWTTTMENIRKECGDDNETKFDESQYIRGGQLGKCDREMEWTKHNFYFPDNHRQTGR